MTKEKLIKAMHEGEINLGVAGDKLDVAVLDDGTRIITMSAVFKALGRPVRGNSRLINMPVFMDAQNLQPFISEDLRSVINKVEYLGLDGKIKEGYNALILPLVSDLYLKARQENALKTSQVDTAKKAEILVRSLAKLGITALIDEATGYQYIREKAELQAILQAFISDEILEWQRTFELSFYKEIFRLWNIPFTPANIKKKPLFIGKLTNELVYKNMPKGYVVLETLKDKTPKTASGNYKVRFHQSLTKDAGRTALIKVINTVEALASVSPNKAHFLKLMKEKYNPDTQLPLFPELDKLALSEGNVSKVAATEFNKQLKGLLSVPKPQKD